MLPEDLWVGGRFVWSLALLLALAAGYTHAAAPGFYVSGELSATDTEREGGMVAIGQDIILIVRDKAIFDRQIAPLIGTNVELTLVRAR